MVNQRFDAPRKKSRLHLWSPRFWYGTSLTDRRGHAGGRKAQLMFRCSSCGFNTRSTQQPSPSPSLSVSFPLSLSLLFMSREIALSASDLRICRSGESERLGPRIYREKVDQLGCYGYTSSRHIPRIVLTTTRRSSDLSYLGGRHMPELYFAV